MAIATPSIYFMLGLPLILTLQGFPPSVIGLFQLVGIPMALKLILALPVDRWQFKSNHYKRWSLTMLGVYALTLIWIAQLSLKDDFYLLLASVAFAQLAGTLADIPLSALAIKIFAPRQRQKVSSYKNAAFSSAFVLGGGFLLMFYNHFGWQAPLYLMAGFTLFTMILFSVFVEESEYHSVQKTTDTSGQKLQFNLQLITGFFKQPHAIKWSLFLTVYFGFIGVAWVYIKPVMLNQGFDADTVSLAVGVWGGIFGVLISINSHHFTRWLTKRRLLWLTSLTASITMAYTALLIHLDASIYAYIISISLISAGISLSSALLTSLMMDYARHSVRAIDYGLQTSIMNLSHIVLSMIAGMVIMAIEYQGLFALLTVGLVWLTWLSFRLKNAIIHDGIVQR